MMMLKISVLLLGAAGVSGAHDNSYDSISRDDFAESWEPPEKKNSHKLKVDDHVMYEPANKNTAMEEWSGRLGRVQKVYPDLGEAHVQFENGDTDLFEIADLKYVEPEPVVKDTITLGDDEWCPIDMANMHKKIDEANEKRKREDAKNPTIKITTDVSHQQAIDRMIQQSTNLTEHNKRKKRKGQLLHRATCWEKGGMERLNKNAQILNNILGTRLPTLKAGSKAKLIKDCGNLKTGAKVTIAKTEKMVSNWVAIEESDIKIQKSYLRLIFDPFKVTITKNISCTKNGKKINLEKDKVELMVTDIDEDNNTATVTHGDMEFTLGTSLLKRINTKEAKQIFMLSEEQQKELDKALEDQKQQEIKDAETAELLKQREIDQLKNDPLYKKAVDECHRECVIYQGLIDENDKANKLQVSPLPGPTKYMTEDKYLVELDVKRITLTPEQRTARNSKRTKMNEIKRHRWFKELNSEVLNRIDELNDELKTRGLNIPEQIIEFDVELKPLPEDPAERKQLREDEIEAEKFITPEKIADAKDNFKKTGIETAEDIEAKQERLERETEKHKILQQQLKTQNKKKLEEQNPYYKEVLKDLKKEHAFLQNLLNETHDNCKTPKIPRTYTPNTHDERSRQAKKNRLLRSREFKNVHQDLIRNIKEDVELLNSKKISSFGHLKLIRLIGIQMPSNTAVSERKSSRKSTRECARSRQSRERVLQDTLKNLKKGCTKRRKTLTLDQQKAKGLIEKCYIAIDKTPGKEKTLLKRCLGVVNNIPNLRDWPHIEFKDMRKKTKNISQIREILDQYLKEIASESK